MALVAYLCLWPVPIHPIAWTSPPALAGPYARNNALAAAELLPLGTEFGPETVTFGPDGLLYAALRGRNAADDRIVELVRAAEDPAALQVVTSDRELRRRVAALGASVGRVGELRASLDAIED